MVGSGGKRKEMEKGREGKGRGEGGESGGQEQRSRKQKFTTTPLTLIASKQSIVEFCCEAMCNFYHASAY